MTDFQTEIAIVVMVIALMVALHFYTEAKVKQLQRDIEALDKRLSEHWRTHKDDYYENRRNHELLAEALGMEMSPSKRATYVVKEQK